MKARPMKQLIRNLFAVMITVFCAGALAAQVQEFSPSTGGQVFTVAEGVSEITVEVWAGGGKGGDTEGNNAAGGGGGAGGYARATVDVSPGDEFGVEVGSGGTAGSRDGAASSFGIDMVTATGGEGLGIQQVGAQGGQGSFDSSQVREGITMTGGSGTTGSTGGNGSGGNGGNAPNGVGIVGGSGGSGGNDADGDPGNSPGGGGGGGHNAPGGGPQGGDPRAGGSGGNGRVRITYQVDDVTLPVFDNFESYPPGASINGNDGGSNWGGPWDGVAGQTIIDTSANPLEFIDSRGRRIRSTTTLAIAGNNDEIASRPLDGTFSGDTLFLSMLVRFNGAPTNNDFVGFWIERPTFGDSPQFGLKVNEGGSGTDDFFVRLDQTAGYSADLAVGETYLRVAEYSKGSDNFFSNARLWVNPECEATPPTTPAAERSVPPANRVSEVSSVGFRSANLSGSDRFEIGQVAVGTRWIDVVNCSPGPIAEYRMEEPEWTGAAGEVADSTGNGFNGTMQNAGADTSITNPGPALPSDPGTCRYGAFDGNSYIEIADFPDLEDSFSITGWFRTRDRTEVGQRIFADDETNNNGYAVSLGDGGPGRIRFYHRALNPISLDTPPVIQNDTWYFVGAVLDESSQQKYIYIYDASGNLIDQTQGGYTGSLQTDGGTASIGGETNSGENQNRFRGSLDEIRVFDSALSSSEVESVYSRVRPCAVSPLANFEVVGPGTASVCEPAEITIRARDTANNPVSDYSGTVNLTTSSGNGNWNIVSGNGTLSPQPDNDNNGQAQYTFVNGDSGEIRLGLSNRLADALTISVADTSGGQNGTSGVIQFQENAFVITQSDSLGDDFVAGRNHQLRVRVISRDSVTDECGLVTEYDGNIDLKGWIQRTGDDPGGASPRLADGAGTDTMPNTEPANNNTILAFNQGVATPQWLTTDVGRYALNLKDDSSGIVVDENGDPRPVVGASQEWTVRPFGFHVSVARNPGASSAIGPPFLAAGRPFDLTVRAVVHEVGDDSDDNGIPDDHTVADPTANADLSNNTTTNAFGDGPPLTVGLAADLVAHPSSPANPGLSGAVSASSFTNGEATVSASYLEVGSISIIGDIGGSYLGRSATVIGRSGYVGRFHPELFTAQAMDGSFATECNGFVYSGQVHDYDLAPVVEITPRAHDAAGTGPLVSNYRENWQRLRKEDVSRIFPTEDADNGLDVTVGSVDATLTPLGDGRMDYVFGDDEYTYVKNQSSLMGPFASDLVIQIDRIDDGDAQLEPSQNPVELNPVGVPIRYGRLQLENAFGPETLPLLIPMRAEYWDGNRFVLNEEENGFMTSECWQYNPSGLEVDGSRLELNPGSVANNISADDTFGLDMGQPDPGMDPGGPDDGRIRLKSKSDELQPGDQNEEGVRFIVPIWLQGDFDGNGSLENPSALATFGVYRGNDRVIYWQER